MVKFDQMWFIFQHAVHRLLPTVLQRLDSHGREALILIWEKVLSCRYDLITGQILLPSQVFFFSFWGTENSLMMPNQENMEGNQPVQATDMHSSHCNHRLVWRSIVLVKQDPFISFPGHLKMSLLLLFKVLNYLSSVGLPGRKQLS